MGILYQSSQRTVMKKCHLANVVVILANLNAIVLDFVARQKIHGQNLNLFIVEQLPVVPLVHFENGVFWS